MHLMFVLAAVLNASALGTVEGLVVSDGYPLPGCTIGLESASHETRFEVSDADGRYRFHGVPNGEWDLHVALEGFDDRYQHVVVRDGNVTVPPVTLRMMAIVDTITVTCGLGSCSDLPPSDRYGIPTCRDFELNTTLIEAAERDDRSSIGLLRARYDAEVTLVERHRIARALLRRLPDDTTIWNELASQAEVAVRFPEKDPRTPSAEYSNWCNARGLDPVRYWFASLDALRAISDDPRSRDLLLRAGATENAMLQALAAEDDAAGEPR